MRPSSQRFAGKLQVFEICHRSQAHAECCFSRAVPHRLPLDPSAHHVSVLVEHSEIRIGTGSKRTLPVLDSQTSLRIFLVHFLTRPKQSPCRVESGALDRLPQRTPGELDKVPDASVQSDDAPSESGGPLKVQFKSFLHESLSLSPLMNAVLQIRIQDLHGYPHGSDPGLPITSRTWGTYHP